MNTATGHITDSDIARIAGKIFGEIETRCTALITIGLDAGYTRIASDGSAKPAYNRISKKQYQKTVDMLRSASPLRSYESVCRETAKQFGVSTKTIKRHTVNRM